MRRVGPRVKYAPSSCRFRASVVLLALVQAAGGGWEAQVAELPPAAEAVRPAADWLIDPSAFTARVVRTDRPAGIALDNGLIRRTFLLSPNAATVGLDQFVSGQALVRGVKPEARIEIDGAAYEVGGLKGQPNYAYLLPEWLDALDADPAALAFEGFSVGRPSARIPWKRVRPCAPGAAWPPAGVALHMNYRMPPPRAGDAAAALDSGAGRTPLYTDDFSARDPGWTIHASPAHARSSFENEGKVGEIYTPANTCVFAERVLPPETRLVEVVIDPGTDRAGSWGPGIALVWPERAIKFYLRPGGHADSPGAPVFGLWDGLREHPSAGGGVRFDPARPVVLRLRIGHGAVGCEARQDGRPWTMVAHIPADPAAGPPRAVRIGKSGKTGDAADFDGEPGAFSRLRMLRFAAYGPLDPAAAAVPATPLDGLRVTVHYELYDGLPCLAKWVTISNGTAHAVEVGRCVSEILAVVEYESLVDAGGRPPRTPNIAVDTDYAMSGMAADQANRFAVRWLPDPDYRSQVHYERQTPCLLEVGPELGPAQRLAPGEVFTSIRAFLLPNDGYDRERAGLARRRMYRTVAPWVTENPLMMHVRWSDEKTVRQAVDQCAAVGFEMVILTFGSGFTIENENADYLATMKAYADYARARGVEIGGYSLLASRRVGGGHDVVLPPGERPRFGNSPCLQSVWGRAYFDTLYRFFGQTGFSLLEHDGSYPGDPCLAEHHPGHRGWEDSRWRQRALIGDFYAWCRGQGIYLNVPDYYYLSGSNKSGMGYREVNWSLPRDQQVLHTRQNIYDGTWEKTPSMGWMFVPLTQYHGGGAAATIEPLDEHRDHYERMLVSNLALGVQACYRGPRLYDTDRTRELVKQWVDWYKQYRAILESDVIHGRRADGRDLDWMLHVNPRLATRGLLAVFNPLPDAVSKTLTVNLYYTGLTGTARVSAQGNPPVAYPLARDYTIALPVTVPARGMAWYVVEE